MSFQRKRDLKHESKLKRKGLSVSSERDELIMTSPPSNKHLSKLKRAHPEEDKIILLTAQKLGYWRSEIDFVELDIRFTSPSPFWQH